MGPHSLKSPIPHRKTNTFQAYNFTDNASLPLLPSIARWRYDNKVICLLERTDGSMWMSAIHPKASAANLAAKLGGYENSNVFQITQPTSKVAPPSYVELAGGPSQPEKPNPTPAAAFSDVNAEAYYAGAVKWAVEKGITAGTSATTFSPSDTCTRAHILTFLWRAVGSPKSTANNPFSDVKADDYYYDAAIWASEKGMVTGNQFNGNTPCTRSSTVVYLWQNAGAPKTAVSNVFSDVPAGSEYAQAVAWAVKTGVTSGTSETTFSPDTICDRGQIVTFLNRAMK